MIDKLTLKALGQTIEHSGKVILVIKEMPVNCMVLFVDMLVWSEIRGGIVLSPPEKPTPDKTSEGQPA